MGNGDGHAVAAAILDPVLNGPYDVPTRHFVIGPKGPTGEVRTGRRPSESFIPVAPVRKRGRKPAAKEGMPPAEVGEQLTLGLVEERRQDNPLINELRRDVANWRDAGYPGTTATTAKLLHHWADKERENRILFAQREAAETAIFLSEVAGRTANFRDRRAVIAEFNAEHNEGIPRIALKMATGSGKTVVMAMLIAWQTLNKVANPSNPRYAKRFLVITPGITIRDRLRVLQPNDPQNYYRLRGLVPSDLEGLLGKAQIIITNYHSFLLKDAKEIKGVARTTRQILLAGKNEDPFKETEAAMVSRVLRGFGGGKQSGEIVVLNDEAHHCYMDKPITAEASADGVEAADAEDKARNEDARVWFKGIRAIQEHVGVKAVYDLSATPFYLGGSGYKEGYIFPWTVSDFSLMDAIESGIVKAPRASRSTTTPPSTTVTYRNLWDAVGKDLLPKRGPRPDRRHQLGDARRARRRAALPLPLLREGLRALAAGARAAGGTTTGLHRRLPQHGRLQARPRLDRRHRGNPRRRHDAPRPRPPAALHERRQRDQHQPRQAAHDPRRLRPARVRRGDEGRLQGRRGRRDRGLQGRVPSPQPRRRRRRPHRRGPAARGDEHRRQEGHARRRRPLRRLGRMLTEGWDANTVTHILGIRAFKSQLLCEQVVGRGLRRRSYAVNDEGRFEAEYANVYGVPFMFIGGTPPKDTPPPLPATEVRTMPGREKLRITFPKLDGYRLEVADEELWLPDELEPFTIGPGTVPSWTQSAPVVGEPELIEDEITAIRPRAVAYQLAKRLTQSQLATKEKVGDSEVIAEPRPWLFPRVADLCTQWIERAVVVEEGWHLGHLAKYAQWQAKACDAVYAAITSQQGDRRPSLRPILRRHDPEGDTGSVNFSTRKNVLPAADDRCEISHVVLDGVGGNTWEQLTMQECEHNPNVAAYAKNDHLGFSIPYIHEGKSHDYVPDFLVRLKRREGEDFDRVLVIEVSGGQKSKHSPGSVKVKATTARQSWCTAVNNHGGFGRWGYVEITNPLDIKPALDDAIRALYADGPIIGDPDLLDLRRN